MPDLLTRLARQAITPALEIRPIPRSMYAHQAFTSNSETSIEERIERLRPAQEPLRAASVEADAALAQIPMWAQPDLVPRPRAREAPAGDDVEETAAGRIRPAPVDRESAIELTPPQVTHQAEAEEPAALENLTAPGRGPIEAGDGMWRPPSPALRRRSAVSGVRVASMTGEEQDTGESHDIPQALPPSVADLRPFAGARLTSQTRRPSAVRVAYTETSVKTPEAGVIKVTIGRVEVRAVQTPEPQAREKPIREVARLSLESYLTRQGDRR